MDTIDASALDTSFLNHSYYAENKSVITDLFQLIKLGFTPQERLCLSQREKNDLPYWIFNRCR